MRRAAAMLTVLAATAATGAGLATAGAASSAPAYSVQTLHFLVHVGPTGAQDCDVIGDLYTPATASASHLVPAILTTNGFGGSKDDQAGIGAAFATRGYEVLSYSGLGFGGSGCQITLDDPVRVEEEVDQDAAHGLILPDRHRPRHFTPASCRRAGAPAST